MQFCQPGYAYTGPPSTTPFILNGYPEILGEGNLASVVSPNGSMQLVFVPTSQWLRPLPYQTPQNTNNANWTPTTAWIIRSVLNPVQPTFYQQPQPQTCFQPVQNNSLSQFSPAPWLPPGPFELKFHNDICTSTSDILYFYPNLRTYETMCLANLRKCPSIRLAGPPPSRDFANEAISLRSDLEPMDTVKMSVSPTSTSSFDMSEDSDCACRKKHKKKRKTDNKCECKAVMNNRKTNGITCECKAVMNKRRSNGITCECKAVMNKRRSNDTSCECKAGMNKIKNKKNTIICECKEEADKGVATFTDQASGCVGVKGRETQTALQNGCCNTRACTITPLKKATRCGSSVYTVGRCSSVITCCDDCCTD